MTYGVRIERSEVFVCYFFFFQAEDGIRYLVRSRGLGDVYKRQPSSGAACPRGEGQCVRAGFSSYMTGHHRTGAPVGLSLIHI